MNNTYQRIAGIIVVGIIYFLVRKIEEDREIHRMLNDCRKTILKNIEEREIQNG